MVTNNRDPVRWIYKIEQIIWIVRGSILESSIEVVKSF